MLTFWHSAYSTDSLYLKIFTSAFTEFDKNFRTGTDIENSQIDEQ